MKSRILVFALLSIFVSGSMFAQKNTKTVLKNELDSLSYSMGLAIGTSMKTAGIKQLNDKMFVQAVNEAIGEKEPVLKVEQANQIIQAYMIKMRDSKGKENIAAGKKFLEENKAKEGVITLPSGLQYKILKDGQGESPKLTDKVTVHYHGTLTNGKVFDSSVQRGQPVQLTVNGVIAGWTEALQLMKPGSKWVLYIPAELGYGEQGVPGIEPNSVLVFEVELISIDKEATTAPETQGLQ